MVSQIISILSNISSASETDEMLRLVHIQVTETTVEVWSVVISCSVIKNGRRMYVGHRVYTAGHRRDKQIACLITSDWYALTSLYKSKVPLVSYRDFIRA